MLPSVDSRGQEGGCLSRLPDRCLQADSALSADGMNIMMLGGLAHAHFLPGVVSKSLVLAGGTFGGFHNHCTPGESC